MVIIPDRFCFSHTKNFQDILLADFYGQEQMFCSIGDEPFKDRHTDKILFLNIGA